MKKTYILLLSLMAFGIAPIANAQGVPQTINFFTTDGYTNNSELGSNANWETSATWNNQVFCAAAYGYQRYTANWARSQWQTPIQAAAGKIIRLRLDFNPSSGAVANSTNLLNFGLISTAGIPEFENGVNNSATYIKTDASGNYTLDAITTGTVACVINETKYIVVELYVGSDATNSKISSQLFNAADESISATSRQNGVPADLYTAITGTGAYAVFAGQDFKSGGGFQRIDISRFEVSVINTATYNGSWITDPIGLTNTELDVTIASGSVAFTGTSSFKSLTINGAANTTLADDASITTANNLTIDSGASLIISNGGSLIVSGNSSGDVTYNRTVDFDSGALKGWYLMASPVVGQDYNDGYVTANDIAVGTGANRGIANYTTSDDTWSYLQSEGTGTFSSGKGYSIKRETSTGTVSFTGTLNTSDAGVDFVLDNAGNRINLLGNPYTSSISSATLLGNAALSETKTMWIYDQTSGTNGGYAVSTLGDNFILAPGQGFFVTANAAGGTVNFAEANQSHNADTFQKTANTEIKVQISVDSFQNYAKVYYLDNATNGFDVGYEGELFGGATDNFSIYTQLLTDNIEKKYQVQSLPNSGYESMVVPVGVKASAGKEVTFSADALNLPSDIKVFLEDRLTNTFTRLDETNSEYQVTLTESLNGVGRFYLHTAQSVLSTEDVILNSVRVFKTEASSLKITGLPQGKTSFYLYNILGKEMMTTIFTSNGNKEISLSKLTAGIYLAKIQTEKGAISKKIILE